MKIPKTPPDHVSIFKKVLKKNESKVEEILRLIGPEDKKGRYLHWEDVRVRQPPQGLNHEEWWAVMKWYRQKFSVSIPDLVDVKKRKLHFVPTPGVLQHLRWIDENILISPPALIKNPESKKKLQALSLRDEAITSSQIEGAATTYAAAEKMLKTNRKPKNKDEQMIYNNYQAMQFIQSVSQDDLSIEMILHLHEILTRKTLRDPSKAGCLRKEQDHVEVVDVWGEVLHTPPGAGELSSRLQALCDFASFFDPWEGIHPCVAAIVLHYQLAYDHPFVDGNGRTARALFYWFLSKCGYDAVKYISISHLINQAPVQYGRAFLHVETDSNDVTYFVLHQLVVLHKALERWLQQVNEMENNIKQSEQDLANILKKYQLNERQMQLLQHALAHSGYVYGINEHKNQFGVVYETARKDLLDLAQKHSLLDMKKSGKAFAFISPEDLRERLRF